MSDGTKIEWTDATWNPITGCSVVSPGCTNCYAMRLAGTRLKHISSRTGLTRDTKAGPVWTGEVRFNEPALGEPPRWRRPRMIFVCAHGDLFAENVPDAWIDRVFAVMALSPQHTFQVLTKRPERMRAYVSSIADRLGEIMGARVPHPAGERALWDLLDPAAFARPLPNVWLGFSAEDQRRFDEREDAVHCLAADGWTTWCSAEPLLGPLEMGRAARWLRWLVAGGESGPGARPMHPDWARSLRDQCAAAGVPFLFKQWGVWKHMPERAHFKEAARKDWKRVSSDQDGVRPALMFNVGKKAAGRTLDGVTHDAFPEHRHAM